MRKRKVLVLSIAISLISLRTFEKEIEVKCYLFYIETNQMWYWMALYVWEKFPQISFPSLMLPYCLHSGKSIVFASVSLKLGSTLAATKWKEKPSIFRVCLQLFFREFIFLKHLLSRFNNKEIGSKLYVSSVFPTIWLQKWPE